MSIRLTQRPGASRCIVRILFASCWALPASAQVSVLPTPSIDPVRAGEVEVLHRLPDGRTLVGGNFTRTGLVAAAGCARLQPDGSPDAGFQCAASSARLFAHDAQGRVYVVGPSAFVVNRLLPNGGLDPAFPPVNADASIGAMAVTVEGLYIAGAFSQINGTPRQRIARLSLDGTLDPDWTAGADGSVFSALAPGDGFLYLGGAFATLGGAPRARVGRLALPTGSVDAWDAGLASSLAGFEVTTMAHDGAHLYLSGAFDSVQGQQRRRLAKLATGATAALDASWAPQILSFSTQFSGPRLLRVIGDSVYVGDTGGMLLQSGALSSSARLQRLSRTGAAALDIGFDPFADIAPGASAGPIALVAGDGGGRLFVGGRFSQLSGGQVRLGLAALNADGSPDALTALAEAQRTAAVSGVARDVDSGVLYLVGDFQRVNGVLRQGLVRLFADGAVDSGFRPVARNYTAVALAEGGLYVADDDARQLRRLDPLDGDPDPGFTPIGYTQTLGLLQAEGAHLYLLGSFQLNGIAPTLARLARMRLADGTIDTDFRFTPSAGGFVNGLAFDAASDSLFLFGSFSTLNGVPTQHLARVGATSLAVDPLFAPAPGAPVQAAVVDDGGGLWLSGGFTTLAGQPCRAPARLLIDADGALDPGFSCNRSPLGSGALAYARGAIYGQFGGVLRRFARADGGTADPQWVVTSILGQLRIQAAPGRLLVSGSFDSIAGAPRRSLAALAEAGRVFGDGFE